jgi:nitrogenase molybdenum-iron protein alpha/beta subunit
MVEPTSEHSKAIAKQAAVNEEKTKDNKLNKYLKLVTVDTANFSAEQKAGHDIMLKHLTKELFHADES